MLKMVGESVFGMMVMSSSRRRSSDVELESCMLIRRYVLAYIIQFRCNVYICVCCV